MTALEALARAPLFKDFTETGLRIFAAIAQEKTIPAGSPIFVGGLPGGSYQCTVAATNASGTGPASAPVGADIGGHGACDAPTLTAPTRLSSAPGNASAVVSWSPATPCDRLQSATSIIGPWADIVGATNGQVLATSGIGKFFRIAH